MVSIVLFVALSVIIRCFLLDGTLVFVNNAFCRYFNEKRERLIGQDFMLLIPIEDQEEIKNHISKSVLARYSHYSPDILKN